MHSLSVESGWQTEPRSGGLDQGGEGRNDMAFAIPTGDSVRPTDWAGLGWLFLFFWYFPGINQLLLLTTGFVGSVPLRQSLVFSLLWLVPVMIFPRMTRPFAAVIGVILWFFSLFGLFFYFIYQQEFSQSVIFIIFESNETEASEYAAQYFAWWMIPALLAYTTGAVLLWKRLRPVFLSGRHTWGFTAAVTVLLFIFPIGKAIANKGASLLTVQGVLEKNMGPVIPWQMPVAYIQYREQLASMQALLEDNARLPPLANLRDAHAGQPSTLVLVIGESTNRQHMSLYGYARPTTPKLDAMRDQLLVFNNVVSPRPYTIEVLQQALTFADQEHPNLYLTRPSLMNMMKQAGYKSYWITNQQTLTKRNTMLTTFSKQTEEQFYLNHNRSQNSPQYDGAVLEPFQQILRDPAPRKFIVVHLLGTHSKYHFRFPPEYEQFSGRKGLPTTLDDNQVEVVNDYDNAVLYNDYVVSSLIASLSQASPHAMLVYFSDHGEDVFDSAGHKVFGRIEDTPTLPMYAIPFLVWMSDGWRSERPLNYSRETLDRHYSTSHFIHTWAELAGLTFDDFEASKSLVNKAFKERPLLVGNPYKPKSMTDLRAQMPAAEGR